jgi:hypothetical protein
VSEKVEVLDAEAPNVEKKEHPQVVVMRGQVDGWLNHNAVPEVVKTEAQAMALTNALGGIARIRKAAESTRKLIVKPMNDQVKEINATFKAVVEPLEEPERKMKSALADYQRRQREAAEEAARRAAEEQRRAQEEAEARAAQDRMAAQLAGLEPSQEDPVVAVAPVVPEMVHVPTIHTAAATASTTRRWTWEITDLNALLGAIINGEAPPELVQVIGKEVMAYTKPEAMGKEIKENGAQPIPGIRFFQEEGIAVRT